MTETPVARVAIVNLGCRLNRVESDLMASALIEAGCALVAEEEAQAVVVNTCAVTGEAEAKTRKAIRHAAGISGVRGVVATGCVASLFRDELAALGENVLVEADKRLVARDVLQVLGEPVADGPLVDVATPTPTGRTRPGIKVQDGCDNRCTFCIVWKARGAARSVDPERVRAAVLDAMAHGAHEVVLTGINLGSYRYTYQGEELRLPGLLRYLLENTRVERIRLSSLEPPDVTEDLVATMAQAEERIAPFLHVCLQSGCDATLARMGRVYDTALYRRVVGTARRALPELSLGCDLIVGFPGETDEEFGASLAFCREMGFSKMHVFRYSRRPGTPAATMEGQVTPEVMAERSHAMRALAEEMRRSQAKALVGKEGLMLVQYPGRAVTPGLFDVLVDDDIPVDSLVRLTPHALAKGSTLDARTVC